MDELVVVHICGETRQPGGIEERLKLEGDAHARLVNSCRPKRWTWLSGKGS